MDLIQELIDFLDVEEFHTMSLEEKIRFIPSVFKYFNGKNIKFDDITNEFYKTILDFTLPQDKDVGRKQVLLIIEKNCQTFLNRPVYLEKKELEKVEEEDGDFVSSYDVPNVNDKYSEYDIPDKQYDWEFLKEIDVENPE